MAACAQGQRSIPDDIGHGYMAGKDVGKKCTAARHPLPFQCRAKLVGINRDQDKVALACKMLGSGFHHLLGGRQMDKTIGKVDGRAKGFPLGFQIIPFGAAGISCRSA